MSTPAPWRNGWWRGSGILIEQRRAGFVRRGGGRIEREVGQELLAGAVAGGDLLELRQVGGAHRRVVMQALKMRLIPAPHRFELGRPTRRAAEQNIEQRDEILPFGARARRRI